MSSGSGSPWSERLVNGESNKIGAVTVATGAVSCGRRGVGVGGGDGVGGGGGSGGGGGGGGGSVSSVTSRGSSGSANNIDSGGNNSSYVPVVTVATVVIGSTLGGASYGICDDDVTLPDARGTTLAVNHCRETTVFRACGSDGSGGDDDDDDNDDDDDDDDAVATTDCRELGSAVLWSSDAETTTTTPVDAGNIVRRKIYGNSSSSSTTNTATAAVVVVDAVPTLFHDDVVADDDDDDDDGDGEEEEEEEEDADDDDEDEDDNYDDEEEEEEEEEEEVHRHRHKHGNMVAAMNEHLSSTTTTTTSSPAAANGARTTNSIIATSSSFSASSIMTTTNAIISGNINSPAMSAGTNTAMSTATMIGSGANSNSCNNTRNQDYQEMDCDDVKTTATTTTNAAAGILSFPCDFDHMYASMTDGGAPAVATATAAAAALGVSPLRGNEPRQNDLTEVKHLKELLLLHLDLIQQQSEQIVTKDKLLAALRQENETLKLRLERMERRVSLQKLKSEYNENSTGTEHLVACSPSSVNSVNVASTSELHRNIQSESSNILHESFKIRLNTSGGITTVKQEPHDNQSKHEVKQEPNNEARFEWEEKKKRRSDPTPLSTGSKKKRGLSCSSAISTDTSSNIQDKVLSQTSHEVNRKNDRKTKSLTKKESFLMTEEHYYTAVGDPSYTLSLKQSSPVETGSSLEIPNWRVKIYTSCYTMEGTENLDDEIFNKRHLKLENDERRRKRWDVQRIREQRHIEKLKQRQERQNHQATCYNTNHTGPCPSSMEEETITSLWPDVEQIQSLQVDPHLPVTAFGTPIPSFIPSEFSLPWSNIMRMKCRRPKRSTDRRKSTGRRKV